MKKFIDGLIFLLKILLHLLRQLCKNFENLLELFIRKRKKEKGTPACCIKVPDGQRPRPDPYIYSQEWLMKRGFAVTWENPDFTIFDMSGNVVGSSELAPATTYRIEITIHNTSPMAALNTKVHLTIHPFGIQTGAIWGSATNTLDIPAVGFNRTDFTWDTPNDTGHICLIATIFHIDDANPLNNVGQHNADIIRGGDTKKLSFKMQNLSKARQRVVFAYDTYSLPVEPLHAKSMQERRSREYLKRLQSLNSRASHTVEQGNLLKGTGNEMVLEPGTEMDIEVDQGFFTNNTTLNINAFSGDQVLLGGVTFKKTNK